ncbi:hypothetical protein ACEPPN_002541 [Leptodophora sp. 'Broadleaf-Isolate-01']
MRPSLKCSAENSTRYIFAWILLIRSDVNYKEAHRLRMQLVFRERGRQPVSTQYYNSATPNVDDGQKQQLPFWSTPYKIGDETWGLAANICRMKTCRRHSEPALQVWLLLDMGRQNATPHQLRMGMWIIRQRNTSAESDLRRRLTAIPPSVQLTAIHSAPVRKSREKSFTNRSKRFIPPVAQRNTGEK